jgi:hypothetical protein
MKGGNATIGLSYPAAAALRPRGPVFALFPSLYSSADCLPLLRLLDMTLRQCMLSPPASSLLFSCVTCSCCGHLYQLDLGSVDHIRRNRTIPTQAGQRPGDLAE